MAIDIPRFVGGLGCSFITEDELFCGGRAVWEKCDITIDTIDTIRNKQGNINNM